MDKVYLVVLGSVLALGTSFLMEKYKGSLGKKEHLRNFKTVLKLESKYIISILDKLTENYNTRNFFPIGYLNQLDKSIQRVEKIRLDTVYLKQENKKEEILNCINELSIFYSDAQGTENYILQKIDNETSEENKNRMDYCTRQRPILAFKEKSSRCC